MHADLVHVYKGQIQFQQAVKHNKQQIYVYEQHFSFQINTSAVFKQDTYMDLYPQRHNCLIWTWDFPDWQQLEAIALSNVQTECLAIMALSNQCPGEPCAYNCVGAHFGSHPITLHNAKGHGYNNQSPLYGWNWVRSLLCYRLHGRDALWIRKMGSSLLNNGGDGIRTT